VKVNPSLFHSVSQWLLSKLCLPLQQRPSWPFRACLRPRESAGTFELRRRAREFRDEAAPALPTPSASALLL
jgi:hypothetical protein